MKSLTTKNNTHTKSPFDHNLSNSRSTSSHRPGDNSYSESTSNVISAAETLSIAIQQCKNFTSSSSPNKETIGVINSWLENFMPVSRAIALPHLHMMKNVNMFCYGSSIGCTERERKSVFKTQFELQLPIPPLKTALHSNDNNAFIHSVGALFYCELHCNRNMRAFRMSLWANKNHMI